METGLYKEMRQSKITVVILDGIIIGDFYYPVYSFQHFQNFLQWKYYLKIEKQTDKQTTEG